MVPSIKDPAKLNTTHPKNCFNERAHPFPGDRVVIKNV